MKIKVVKATPRQLDEMVAICEGIVGKRRVHIDGFYSSSWKEGGPIIDQHNICIGCGTAYIGQGDEYFGETNLIAAMRCYVASKLGDEVEIPDELMEK